MEKIKILIFVVLSGVFLLQETPARNPAANGLKELPVKNFCVVIDPGHGGKDGGAVGNKGTQEKNVVLDIASMLAKVLVDNAGRNYKVVLTRAEDKFIALEDRITFANQAEGDIFISIHANASESRNDNGFEVYYNSLATDDALTNVARRENAGAAERKDPQPTDSMFVLWELAQNEFQKESMNFADAIQAGVETAVSKPGENGKKYLMRNRGVKQAGFAVLRGVRMPAVLVETSYLSNENDENNLRSPEFKEKMVEGLFEAIEKIAGKINRRQDGLK